MVLMLGLHTALCNDLNMRDEGNRPAYCTVNLRFIDAFKMYKISIIYSDLKISSHLKEKHFF